MKHRIFGKKLGRNHNERQALLKSLSYNLFLRGSIETTDAKAKAVISLVERLCSVSVKKDSLIASRELGRYFQDKNFIKATLEAIKNTFGDQQSNFTRMIKSYRRQGDDALMVKLTFVKPFSISPAKEEQSIADSKKIAPKKAETKAKVKKTVKPSVKKSPVKKVKTEEKK